MPPTIRTVWRRRSAAAEKGAFDRFVIVAPAHCLREINDALAAMVIGRLGKDLVKTPDHELWPHLRAWVDVPQRVSG